MTAFVVWAGAKVRVEADGLKGLQVLVLGVCLVFGVACTASSLGTEW